MSALVLIGMVVVAVLVFVVLMVSLSGASKNSGKYSEENFSRRGILAKVQADYSENDRSAVIELLERLGPLGEKQAWVGQAQFAALLLADGDRKTLAEYSDIKIQGDTRDIIVKAGLG